MEDGRGWQKVSAILYLPSSIPACIVLACAVLYVSGCDRSSPQAPQEPSKLHVIATVYPLADIVRRVAGQTVELEWFCENGQDPRDLKLSEEQKQHARSSDLIVTSGFPDRWAGEMLDSRQQALRLMRPETSPTGRTMPDAHGALWLDPSIAREMADIVRERLTVFNAKQEPELRAAFDAFAREIDALDAEFRTRLAPLKGRKFLSLRPMWAPLAARYGLDEISPIDKEPRNLTVEDVRKLKDTAREEGIDVLVIDAALLPGVQRELQLRTGLRLLPLDPLGSSAPDGRCTWIRIMRSNLEKLEKGLR